MDEHAYGKLSEWVLSGFPTPTTLNMMDTMSMRLLRRLSASLLSAEYPSSADTPSDLRIFSTKVELSFDVLKELEAHSNGAPTSENISPVSHKWGKQASKKHHINPLSFDSMGITVPATDVEVCDTYVGILSQLQSILKVCEFIPDGSRDINRP